jgi:UDP-apiose/xylose synthase
MNVSRPTTLCILGCGGFIGSHLVERILAATDWHILGIDAHAAKIIPFVGAPRFTFINADIDEADGPAQEMIRAGDVVISLAALCNPAMYNTIPLEVIASNFTRPMAIVEQCSRQNKWLIHFSTCEVYGKTAASAAGVCFDPAADVFNEETTAMVLGPVASQRWTYACAKQLLERAIFAHGFEQGLAYTIIRPFNFIGPRMDYIPGIDGEGTPRVLACFMDALLARKPLKLVDGGMNYRAFTYIDDAIDAIMAMLRKPAQAKGRIFNIGNPANEVTIAGLAELMIELYRELNPDQHDHLALTESVASIDFYGPGYEDSDRRIPAISQAQSLLGWTPRTALRDALKKTMAAYIHEYADAYECREAI